MSNAMEVSLKLVVDVKGQRVLFGEAGKDFVDLLFHIMGLSVGTVVGLLKEEGMVGCIGNIYDSIQKLGSEHMKDLSYKEVLLNPRISRCADTSLTQLLPNIGSTNFSRYTCVCGRYFTRDPKATCINCGNKMSYQVKNIQIEGYVKDATTFFIMDDLTVKPMSTISSITLLNQFNVKDVSALEEEVVKFGMDEAVKLLKSSLQSKTVLTDAYFGLPPKNY